MSDPTAPYGGGSTSAELELFTGAAEPVPLRSAADFLPAIEQLLEAIRSGDQRTTDQLIAVAGPSGALTRMSPRVHTLTQLANRSKLALFAVWAEVGRILSEGVPARGPKPPWYDALGMADWQAKQARRAFIVGVARAIEIAEQADGTGRSVSMTALLDYPPRKANSANNAEDDAEVEPVPTAAEEAEAAWVAQDREDRIEAGEDPDAPPPPSADSQAKARRIVEESVGRPPIVRPVPTGAVRPPVPTPPPGTREVTPNFKPSSTTAASKRNSSTVVARVVEAEVVEDVSGWEWLDLALVTSGRRGPIPRHRAADVEALIGELLSALDKVA